MLNGTPNAYHDEYRDEPTLHSKIEALYGNTSVYQNVCNPLLDLNDNSVRVSNNRLQGSTSLDYQPVSWLALKSQVGADWQNSWNRVYDYAFSATDGKTFLLPNGNQYNLLSDLNIKNAQTFRWVFNNTA